MDELASEILARRVLPVTNPGAGNDWLVTVAAAEEFTAGSWLIKSVQAKLAVSSGTAQPVLIFDDGAAGGAIGSAGNHTIAGTVGATAVQGVATVTYTWAEDMVQSGIQGPITSDQHSQSPLPMGSQCYLMPGWRFGTHTIGIGAGATWSAITIYYCAIG